MLEVYMKNLTLVATSGQDNSANMDKIANILHVLTARLESFNGNQRDLKIIQSEANQLKCLCDTLQILPTANKQAA